MKGKEAEYIISLTKAFEKPKLKRPKAVLNIINEFVKKHTRIEKTWISKEVNEFIFKNSKNIPRKIEVVFLKQKTKIKVYLKGSKQLEEDKKQALKKAKAKKKKTETKKENEAKTEEEKKKEQELKQKKEQEKAAEAISIKRK